MWTHLAKGDFNCAGLGSWRFDLDPTTRADNDGGGGSDFDEAESDEAKGDWECEEVDEEASCFD